MARALKDLPAPVARHLVKLRTTGQVSDDQLRKMVYALPPRPSQIAVGVARALRDMRA